jgi:hypothetical protein
MPGRIHGSNDFYFVLLYTICSVSIAGTEHFSGVRGLVENCGQFGLKFGKNVCVVGELFAFGFTFQRALFTDEIPMLFLRCDYFL